MGNENYLPCGICPVCEKEIVPEKKVFKKAKKKNKKSKKPYKRKQRNNKKFDYED